MLDQPADFYRQSVVTVHFIQNGEPSGMARIALYSGAGGFLRINGVDIPKDSGAASDSAQSRLMAIQSVLNGTRAQLAGALKLTRQRVYDLLGGQNAGQDTLAHLAALERYAEEWRRRNTRPLGMILPKPAAETEAFWAELAKPQVNELAIATLLDTLAEKHRAFDARMASRASRANADPEAGMFGLLPPRHPTGA